VTGIASLFMRSRCGLVGFRVISLADSVTYTPFPVAQSKNSRYFIYVLEVLEYIHEKVAHCYKAMHCLNTIPIASHNVFAVAYKPRVYRHCEYQSFENWQVVPLTQALGPVQFRPPHCPYFVCSGPAALLVVLGLVVVRVVDGVAVVTALLVVVVVRTPPLVVVLELPPT
jgi:hypothetical protein